jgi:hypothetical protein
VPLNVQQPASSTALLQLQQRLAQLGWKALLLQMSRRAWIRTVQQQQQQQQSMMTAGTEAMTSNCRRVQQQPQGGAGASGG